MDKRYITRKEATAVLSCSLSTIRNYVACGLIKQYGRKGAPRFDRAELEAFIRNGGAVPQVGQVAPGTMYGPDNPPWPRTPDEHREFEIALDRLRWEDEEAARIALYERAARKS